MANATHLSSSKNIKPLQTSIHPPKTKHTFPQIIKITASRKDELPLITNNASKTRRRVITIPASTGRWHGKWSCEYIISLKDLQLDDLAEDGRKHTEVFVTLSLQKHTGFGLSVDGRVVTSIARICSSCSSPYCRKIDTGICVWVLPDGRDDASSDMPEIGSDDPSVIYVKPGCEAELDSLIKDTIRLQTAVKETCSESCEKSEPKLHYIGDQRTASLDRRWSGLLQLRKNIR
ncbi:large ribosomal RNA subunit accumulation protein YCED homolog 2, chloroplastic isoform X1 [Beta vulgaris subsp. vulgaris]|uniref:large ribosomal RNA subunit accumulation protein YCED homolog 2, chloroplastic isoform X1 n=1 Tax=Beta vulgaris subsp. vulgaris TaxID=3555 RepID=UPI002036DF5B|nr:large ribosomal RNA subunit accumulation protein YCED homolog 2, chloroplastic isoform X1 [Beta vulgaris subsp. vulgaris]